MATSGDPTEIMAYFSTEGGKFPPRAANPSIAPIVRSNPDMDAGVMTRTLRMQHRDVAHAIFSPWDIRWYFDEYDYQRHGGEFLYKKVLLKMQKENEDLMDQFLDDWWSYNFRPDSPKAILNSGSEELFHYIEHYRYGKPFLDIAVDKLRSFILSSKYNPALGGQPIAEELAAAANNQTDSQASAQANDQTTVPVHNQMSVETSGSGETAHLSHDHHGTAPLQGSDNAIHGPLPYPCAPVVVPQHDGALKSYPAVMQPPAGTMAGPNSEPVYYPGGHGHPAGSAESQAMQFSGEAFGMENMSPPAMTKTYHERNSSTDKRTKGKNARAVGQNALRGSNSMPDAIDNSHSEVSHQSPRGSKAKARRVTSEWKADQERLLPAPKELDEENAKAAVVTPSLVTSSHLIQDECSAHSGGTDSPLKQLAKNDDASVELVTNVGNPEMNSNVVSVTDPTSLEKLDHASSKNIRNDVLDSKTSKLSYGDPLPDKRVGRSFIGKDAQGVTQLFLANVDNYGDNDLYKIFSAIVPVLQVTVMENRSTHRNARRHFAFLEVKNIDDARKVLEEAPNHTSIQVYVSRRHWTDPSGCVKPPFHRHSYPPTSSHRRGNSQPPTASHGRFASESSNSGIPKHGRAGTTLPDPMMKDHSGPSFTNHQGHQHEGGAVLASHLQAATPTHSDSKSQKYEDHKQPGQNLDPGQSANATKADKPVIADDASGTRRNSAVPSEVTESKKDAAQGNPMDEDRQSDVTASSAQLPATCMVTKAEDPAVTDQVPSVHPQSKTSDVPGMSGIVIADEMKHDSQDIRDAQENTGHPGINANNVRDTLQKPEHITKTSDQAKQSTSQTVTSTDDIPDQDGVSAVQESVVSDNVATQCDHSTNSTPAIEADPSALAKHVVEEGKNEDTAEDIPASNAQMVSEDTDICAKQSEKPGPYEDPQLQERTEITESAKPLIIPATRQHTKTKSCHDEAQKTAQDVPDASSKPPVDHDRTKKKESFEGKIISSAPQKIPPPTQTQQKTAIVERGITCKMVVAMPRTSPETTNDEPPPAATQTQGKSRKHPKKKGKKRNSRSNSKGDLSNDAHPANGSAGSSNVVSPKAGSGHTKTEGAPHTPEKKHAGSDGPSTPKSAKNSKAARERRQFLDAHGFNEWQNEYSKLTQLLDNIEDDGVSDLRVKAESLEQRLKHAEDLAHQDDAKLDDASVSASVKKRMKKRRADRTKSQNQLIEDLALLMGLVDGHAVRVQMEKDREEDRKRAASRAAYPKRTGSTDTLVLSDHSSPAIAQISSDDDESETRVYNQPYAYEPGHIIGEVDDTTSETLSAASQHTESSPTARPASSDVAVKAVVAESEVAESKLVGVFKQILSSQQTSVAVPGGPSLHVAPSIEPNLAVPISSAHKKEDDATPAPDASAAIDMKPVELLKTGLSSEEEKLAKHDGLEHQPEIVSLDSKVATTDSEPAPALIKPVGSENETTKDESEAKTSSTEAIATDTKAMPSEVDRSSPDDQGATNEIKSEESEGKSSSGLSDRDSWGSRISQYVDKGTQTEPMPKKTRKFKKITIQPLTGEGKAVPTATTNKISMKHALREASKPGVESTASEQNVAGSTLPRMSYANAVRGTSPNNKSTNNSGKTSPTQSTQSNEPVRTSPKVPLRTRKENVSKTMAAAPASSMIEGRQGGIRRDATSSDWKVGPEGAWDVNEPEKTTSGGNANKKRAGLGKGKGLITGNKREDA